MLKRVTSAWFEWAEKFKYAIMMNYICVARVRLITHYSHDLSKYFIGLIVE